MPSPFGWQVASVHDRGIVLVRVRRSLLGANASQRHAGPRARSERVGPPLPLLNCASMSAESLPMPIAMSTSACERRLQRQYRSQPLRAHAGLPFFHSGAEGTRSRPARPIYSTPLPGKARQISSQRATRAVTHGPGTSPGLMGPRSWQPRRRPTASRIRSATSEALHCMAPSARCAHSLPSRTSRASRSFSAASWR